MLLASYKSTRPGLQGLANVLIRLRLGGIYSHCELVFQPGDGVDHLMPDGTTAPDENGALWCVSSGGTASPCSATPFWLQPWPDDWKARPTTGS